MVYINKTYTNTRTENERGSDALDDDDGDDR